MRDRFWSQAILMILSFIVTLMLLSFIVAIGIALMGCGKPNEKPAYPCKVVRRIDRTDPVSMVSWVELNDGAFASVKDAMVGGLACPHADGSFRMTGLLE